MAVTEQILADIFFCYSKSQAIQRFKLTLMREPTEAELGLIKDVCIERLYSFVDKAICDLEEEGCFSSQKETT